MVFKLLSMIAGRSCRARLVISRQMNRKWARIGRAEARSRYSATSGTRMAHVQWRRNSSDRGRAVAAGARRQPRASAPAACRCSVSACYEIRGMALESRWDDDRSRSRRATRRTSAGRLQMALLGRTRPILQVASRRKIIANIKMNERRRWRCAERCRLGLCRCTRMPIPHPVMIAGGSEAKRWSKHDRADGGAPLTDAARSSSRA